MRTMLNKDITRWVNKQMHIISNSVKWEKKTVEKYMRESGLAGSSCISNVPSNVEIVF